MDIIFGILGFVFFDNFLLTSAVCMMAAAVILMKRYSSLELPHALVHGCYKALVSVAVVVASILFVGFFLHGQGIDRLAILPFMLAASPLFVCGFIAYAFTAKK